MYLKDRIEQIIAWMSGDDVVHFTIHLTPLGCFALASGFVIVITALTLAAKNR